MKRYETLNGETHTIAEWCRLHGTTNYGRIRKRLAAGWTLEEALQTPFDTRYRKLTIDGQTRTVSAWRRRLNISRGGFDARLRRRGSKLLKPVVRLHEAFGRKQTLNAWSAEYGKKRKTIDWRMRQGMSLELALTLAVGANGRKTKNAADSRLEPFSAHLD